MFYNIINLFFNNINIWFYLYIDKKSVKRLKKKYNIK